jgi:hypothetical protein
MFFLNVYIFDPRGHYYYYYYYYYYCYYVISNQNTKHSIG